MKNAWKSLKALLSDSADLLADENADQEEGKGAAKKAPFKKEDSDDDSDDEGDQEKGKKKEKKKAETTEPESDDNTAETPNTVRLALEDYDKLIALASKAKTATAENKKLKAEADEWDNYQAALSGTKPTADSAGADAKADEQTNSTGPDAEFRKKYGSLMEDC